MQASQRFHYNVPLMLATIGLLSACPGEGDSGSMGPGITCAWSTCANGGAGASATGSGGATGPANAGSGAIGGASGSGGSSGAINGGGSGGGPSGGSGGMSRRDGQRRHAERDGQRRHAAADGQRRLGMSGGGGTAAACPARAATSAVDAGPQLADYTLVVDAPDDGASVSGDVTVSGRAPGLPERRGLGFHASDAAARAGHAGRRRHFELTVDASALSCGRDHLDRLRVGQPARSKFSITPQNVALAHDPSARHRHRPCDGRVARPWHMLGQRRQRLVDCESSFHAWAWSIADSSGNDGARSRAPRTCRAGYTLVFNDEFTSARSTRRSGTRSVRGACSSSPTRSRSRRSCPRR